MVVLGFALAAAAGVISYLENVTRRGYYFSGFRPIVIPLLNPLTMIAALVAWWWLTRLQAHDDAQRVNLRWVYLAFAVQYLLSAMLYLLIMTPFRTFGGFWMTSVLWFYMVGAFVAALGLFLYWRMLRPRAFHDEPSEAVVAP
jgi:hypothetical protein